MPDNNTKEGRHLTPEERIALQAEEIKQLQQENEQLQAQVARMRKALTIANNYMPDIGQFCACGKCKICGADINYAGYEHCIKCARVIIDEALSDMPADYHNPADVEALQQENEQLQAQVARMREALIFTKEKIYEQLSNYVNDPKKFKYSAISIECVQKIVRALADASDYHNPADVEVLRKAKEEIQKSLKNYELVGEHEYDISEHLQIALTAIDKVIGGKEDE